MKKGEYSGLAVSSWMLSKFLGVFLLLVGIKMLMDYSGSVSFMMAVSDAVQFGALTPLTDLLGQLVAYTWPIVAGLIGLSLLACYKKCWAISIFMLYLLLFALAHLWTGDITGASFDLLFVIIASMSKVCCGFGEDCKV